MEKEAAAIIALQDVNISFLNGQKEEPVLTGLNLVVYEGQWVSISGPAGSGKTTLLRIIDGQERRYTGQVQVLGKDLASAAPDDLSDIRLHEVGCIHQDFKLLPYLTVAENIGIQSLLENRKPDFKKVQAAASRFQIEDLLEKPVSVLSGGQKQKTAAARILYASARLVLADEPTASLPQKDRDEILKVLAMLQAAGKTIVCVSHDPVVCAAAQRALRLDKGRLYET